MKKSIKFGMGLLCTALLFAGCKDKESGDGATPTNGVQTENTDGSSASESFERVNGTVKDLEYKGVEYTPYDTTVSEKEIEARIESFVNSHLKLIEVTDRTTVQEGDTVNIDYTGYMDGEAFENGADTGYDLKIGSGSFIPGFEDGLIGAEVSTTVDVNVTFPDPYKNNPDFSGKPATFKVKINKICISEVPEMTDELVAANTDYATVEEYRKYLEDTLKSSKESYAATQKEADVMKALIERAEFEGLKDEDIQKYYESSKTYYDNLANAYETYYGYTYQVFLYYFFGCATEEEYEKLLKENADFEVKKNVILYYVYDKENLTPTDDEVNAAVTKYAAQYGMSEEDFLAQVTREKVQELVGLEKAEQLIYDSAVAKEQ